MAVKKKKASGIKQISTFLAEYLKESDRGAALVAASMIDDLLQEILESYFAEVHSSKELLEGPNAPLGTFSAKIDAAYSLGLIRKKEFEEISLIRKIRVP